MTPKWTILENSSGFRQRYPSTRRQSYASIYTRCPCKHIFAVPASLAKRTLTDKIMPRIRVFHHPMDAGA
jgi:hypothetical protein